MHLLEDRERFARHVGFRYYPQHCGHAVHPTFDVVELPDRFQLFGELAGVRKQDVQLEFTSPRSIQISGFVKAYHSFSKDHVKTGGMPQDNAATTSDRNDEPAPSSTDQMTPKFLATERTLGYFCRTFSFPVEVQKPGCKATLEHGILSVQILKATDKSSEERLLLIH